MKTYKILHAEGFKNCCFDGLTFPITVQAVKIKSGAMKGWIEVKADQFIGQGGTYDFAAPDSTFEFSPAAFVEA